MNSLLTKLIRLVSVVRSGSDTDQFPMQQVEYLDKVADCIMVFPYGMHANVDGNSLAVMMAMNGALDNRVAIPTSMNRRATLASGEVTFYSPVTRSSVTFKANGDVVVDSKNNLIATVAGDASVTADGDATVTVGGSANVTAVGALSLNSSASIALTAPTISLNGATSAAGGISADSVAVSGALTQGGTSVGKAHTHSGVFVGPGVSGPVV
jgi:hypothetical protein